MLGERIRAARAARGMKHVELARALDINTTTLWRYERHDMKPGTEATLHISQLLDVDFTWLVTGMGPTPAFIVEHRLRLERESA